MNEPKARTKASAEVPNERAAVATFGPLAESVLGRRSPENMGAAALVFGHTSPPKAIANPRFESVPFLSRDPEFARMGSRYEFLGTIRGHSVFERRG